MNGRHFLPGGVAGVTFLQVIALILPTVAAASGRPGNFALVAAVSIATALIWEAIFATVRRRGYSFHGLTTALIFMVLVPADVPYWQVVMMLSLGVILGELIFGGRGFGFLNPAAVALSLLVFSFPQVQLAPLSSLIALATLPGAAMLLALGMIAWRTILSAFIGVAVMLMLTSVPIDAVAAGTALIFGVVFLISDPTASAATNPGRWVYGFLAGTLAVLFSANGELAPQGIVFASLLSSIFAPLIDHLVALAHAKRRQVTHA